MLEVWPLKVSCFTWIALEEACLTQDNPMKSGVTIIKRFVMCKQTNVLDRGEKIELLVDKTENLHHQAQDFRNTGTDTNQKKNVAAKHEGQTDSIGYSDCFDPHHSSLSLSWVKLWKVSIFLCSNDATFCMIVLLVYWH